MLNGMRPSTVGLPEEYSKGTLSDNESSSSVGSAIELVIFRPCQVWKSPSSIRGVLNQLRTGGCTEMKYTEFRRSATSSAIASGSLGEFCVECFAGAADVCGDQELPCGRRLLV